MVYSFQAGGPFSTENAKGTVLRNVYPENMRIFFFDDTPSQLPNDPPHVHHLNAKHTKYAILIKRQPKPQ